MSLFHVAGFATFVLCSFLSSTGFAQSSAAFSKIDSPAQTVESPQPSAFAGYRGYAEKNPLINWRSANDLVGRREGHMGHLRASPDAPKTESAPVLTKTAPTPQPKPPNASERVGHDKHEMRKP